MTTKKRYYITILMLITILAGIYGVFSRYREPLDYEPTDVSNDPINPPDQTWTCEGHQCDKL